MQANSGSMRSQTRSAQAADQEEAWPGNRNPSPRDAEEAYCTLDTQSLGRFRRVVQAGDRLDLQQPPSAAEMVIGRVLSCSTSMQPLFWPRGLFSASSSSHDPAVIGRLETLADQCVQEVVPKMPFLCDMPVSIFTTSSRPRYLLIAMASVGSCVLKEPIETSTALWYEAVQLLIGQLETDNSEARSLVLLQAWALLETYALLCSDSRVWKRANMAHGFVETAASRMVRSLAYIDPSQQDHQHLLKLQYTRPLIAYLRLVELLRAILHVQPASFAASEPRTLSFDAQPEGSNDAHGDAIRDHALVGLCFIFADVQGYKILHGALSDVPAGDRVRQCATNIPFSCRAELNNLHQRLVEDLATWKAQYLEKASTGLAMLYHFCHMYLLFPESHLLLASVQYGPLKSEEAGRMGRDSRSLSLPPKSVNYRESLSQAWQVLESSESCADADLPIWAPTAIFMAALVVSRDLVAEDPGSGGVRAKARLLSLFQAELARMNAPCVAEMTRILAEVKETVIGQ